MIDTELLKEKVLDLAMRGKLVEQDPTEGNARQLLEEIELERERLIKEKKIKKSKPLPEINKEEIPYEIPESWEWVRVDEMMLVTMGQSPKKETINLDMNGYEFHQGKSLFANKYIAMSDKYTTAANKVICAPAVVMSVRAPVGDVNLTDRNIFIGRGLAAFQTLGSTDISYIYHYLSTIKKDLEKVSTGSTFKAINSTIIRNIYIPLPPAKEQERIAGRIDHIFKLIDHLADQQDKFINYQKLVQDKALELAMQGKLVPQIPEEGTAANLLEEVEAERQRLIDEKKIKKTKPLPEISEDEIPYDIPESWEWVRLGTIGDIVTGNTPPKKELSYYGGKLPFVKPGDVLNNTINYNTEDYLTKEGATKARLADKNDILITCIGNLGRSAIVKKQIAFNQQLNMIRPYPPIIEKFLKLAISSPGFILKLELEASATTIKIINKSKLSNILIPLPPAEEQQRISSKIDEINQVLYGEH